MSVWSLSEVAIVISVRSQARGPGRALDAASAEWPLLPARAHPNEHMFGGKRREENRTQHKAHYFIRGSGLHIDRSMSIDMEIR